MTDTLFYAEYPLGDSALPPGVFWIDIETRKVDVEQHEVWPYKRRWQPFMVSIAGALSGQTLSLRVIAGEEASLIWWLKSRLSGQELRYSATREFDEMVLRGRFTNARRAHSQTPGPWPNLDRETLAKEVRWRNIQREILPPPSRGPDCASKDVPELWAAGQEKVVTTHCLRDVAELVLTDPANVLSKALKQELTALMRNAEA